MYLNRDKDFITVIEGEYGFVRTTFDNLGVHSTPYAILHGITEGDYGKNRIYLFSKNAHSTNNPSLEEEIEIEGIIIPQEVVKIMKLKVSSWKLDKITKGKFKQRKNYDPTKSYSIETWERNKHIRSDVFISGQDPQLEEILELFYPPEDMFYSKEN